MHTPFQKHAAQRSTLPMRRPFWSTIATVNSEIKTAFLWLPFFPVYTETLQQMRAGGRKPAAHVVLKAMTE
jgi:hypothetical protein